MNAADAKTLGGAPQALVIGSKIVTNAEQAAHINGMLAHADETDDSHAASLSHPGCAIMGCFRSGPRWFLIASMAPT